MYVGIDIGSVTSKAVVINNEEDILAFAIALTRYDRNESGRIVFDQVLKQVGLSEESIIHIVSTGYGRNSLSFSNDSVTEILCHVEGTKKLLPGVRTIIDIGGQDSKVIALDEEGLISKFEMNDKCAAGTGRFLEVMAERILNIDISEMGPLSLQSTDPCVLSCVCTVFAESEVISYLSAHKERTNIAQGLHLAIAKRVIAMGKAAQILYRTPIYFTGGVAKNVGVITAIEEILGEKVIVPEQPQLTAALGAALFAKRKGVS